MAQRFFDTKTGQIRDFTPVRDGQASVYYCGATVQGMPHVGHVRSAIVFDILIRWLEATGLKVTSVRNVTDIDDKILQRSEASFAPDFAGDELYPAREEWFALAYRFEKAFDAAYLALGVRRPTYEPRATGHMTEMFALIQRLIGAGHAYPAQDGSADVYFDVRSFAEYGALTRQNVADMQDAQDADPRGKRDPRDFALWKAAKPGEPDSAQWESPWGVGRPGWHLECSAMATKYLGSRFDIHGGGLDLRFPHHENELAQSSAAGDDFAQFWLHNGLVTYAGEKMSKSVGNTISPQEMLQMARPKAVRYFLGQAHYRSQLDYRPGALEEAAAAVERIDNFVSRAQAAVGQQADGPDVVGNLAAQAPAGFVAAMEDDLNVPQALAALHEAVRAGNAALAAGDHEAAAQRLIEVRAMTAILGLDDVAEPQSADSAEAAALDTLVRAQIQARAQAREEKNWALADQLRDALTAAGIEVQDSADGAVWRLIG
ncbi:MAG: cysteine--tRNA ligase [Micrococcus sp.]|nr:cysteine--tRNA ligase [Micrococcus sp.]